MVTACQEVCPGRAIHFGDLLDPEDPIHAHREEGRHYVLLEEVNTWPRTTYLAHLKNPNPRLRKEEAMPERHPDHDLIQGEWTERSLVEKLLEPVEKPRPGPGRWWRRWASS